MCLLLAQLKIGFFSSFSAAAVYSTNETNKAGLKQSIIIRCLWECHTPKGKQTWCCFEAHLKFVNFLILQQKMSQHIVFNLFFNEDSKMGSAIFVPFVFLKLL